jgi:hypothetical protein
MDHHGEPVGVPEYRNSRGLRRLAVRAGAGLATRLPVCRSRQADGRNSVDILGGGPAVHYPSEYREFDGIMVPTKRQVYVRRPDGSAARDSVSIAIDFTDVTFS